jgi:FkbM family methyltransferase
VFRLLHGFRGVPVSILGHPFRLDESLRRWNTEGEEPVLAAMARVLRRGDTFVDVGANFGLHTIFGARQVGDTGQVIAIEPVPGNYRLLRRNIELNGMRGRVRIVTKAATESPGMRLSLHGVGEGVSVAASLRSRDAVGGTLEVETTTLDQSLEDQAAVRLVKIDVEGAEHLVIKGAQRVLRQQRPHLLIEVHEFALPDYGTSAGLIRADLEALGYRQSVIDVIDGPAGRYHHALYEPC